MKKTTLAAIIGVAIILAGFLIWQNGAKFLFKKVTTYEECVAANGGAATTIYPGRCYFNGEAFVQNITPPVDSR